MKSKIVECVPNFSEGQNQETIDAISEAIRSTDGVSLLDVDPGASTNRTVYTFVGSPDAVIEGALNAARVAYKRIDMTKHKGEHPRLGALDVCPFIPVQGVEMEECIYCARKFSEKLAAELKVPVYLYGYASDQEYRKTVPQIRVGEYEGIFEKITKPEWKPDFGPTEFVPSWGATMAGARKFLIAYNVNVLGTKEQAHRIALDIREQGRCKEEPGKLKKCQAIGWWLDEENIAQVSINLTDHEVTPIHAAYEEVCKGVKELKLAVTGSQIVGIVPLKAMIQAAEYYMNKENLFVIEEDQKLHLAISRLGLNSLGSFNPKERIIEYMLPEAEGGSLVTKSVQDFIKTVSRRTPAPGGGSVAAAVAAMLGIDFREVNVVRIKPSWLFAPQTDDDASVINLMDTFEQMPIGAALSCMVGQMTYGRRQWERYDPQMRRIIPLMHETMNELVSIIDADTSAFNDYMAALKLPKETPEDIIMREAAMEAGLKKAISVPMSLAKAVSKLWDSLKELATIGNFGTKSDLQVGVRCLETGVFGAYYNVIINAEGIKDEKYKNGILNEIEQYRSLAEKGCQEALQVLQERRA